MISFDLECRNGHRFEGWFENGNSFNRQKKEGLISCPYCDNRDIIKLVSSFTTRCGSSKKNNSNMKKLASKLMEYINDNFDDVGSNFTNETLKMHYGVTEPRNIRGVTSPEEEKIMKSEGINFLKVPFYGKNNFN